MNGIERNVGQRLRDARLAAGLTQEKLAERVGVSVQTVSRIERGVQRRTPARRVEEIARALDVDLGDVYGQPNKHDRHAKALRRLTMLLRRRSAEDVELVIDLAERIFRG